MEIKNNDIYLWSYKELPDKDSYTTSYWCKSQIARGKGGVLYDTYWEDFRSPLNLEKVNVIYKGNTDEMESIDPSSTVFYNPDEVVSLRHANNSRQKVYIKQDAKRSPSHTRHYLEYASKKYEYDISWAKRMLEEIEQGLKDVESGDLDKVRTYNLE